MAHNLIGNLDGFAPLRDDPPDAGGAGIVESPTSGRSPWLIGMGLPAILVAPWLASWSTTGATLPGMVGLGDLAGLVLVVMLLTAAITDTLWGKIFNGTTCTALAWAIGLNAAGSWAGEGWGDWLGNLGLTGSLIGALACLVPMLSVSAATTVGAGDVKLVTAMGALLGWRAGLSAMAYAYVAASAFVLLGLLRSVGPRAILADLATRLKIPLGPLGRLLGEPTEDQRSRLRRPIRMGIFFAIGAVAAIFEGALP